MRTQCSKPILITQPALRTTKQWQGDTLAQPRLLPTGNRLLTVIVCPRFVPISHAVPTDDTREFLRLKAMGDARLTLKPLNLEGIQRWVRRHADLNQKVQRALTQPVSVCRLKKRGLRARKSARGATLSVEAKHSSSQPCPFQTLSREHTSCGHSFACTTSSISRSVQLSRQSASCSLTLS